MTKFYERNQRALFSAVGQDIVALNVEDGFCYGMENAAARIWEMLEARVDVATICGDLIDQFDVSPLTCKAEVEAFLDQLEKERLIDVVDA